MHLGTEELDLFDTNVETPQKLFEDMLTARNFNKVDNEKVFSSFSPSCLSERPKAGGNRMTTLSSILSPHSH